MKKPSLILVGLLLFSTATAAFENDNPEPVNTVRQRAQEVVPYDLGQALQTFTKTVHGGIQHVVSKSSGNAREIEAIQAHLSKMANDFRKGDFSVTERVHGSDMPGLTQLKTAKTDDIKFEYKALPNGAQIHYTTEYPQYVQALHEWFDGQLIEHGNDVIQEHSKHHSTPAE